MQANSGTVTVTGKQDGIGFNASRSSSIYQTNATVKPLSRKCMFYIKA